MNVEQNLRICWKWHLFIWHIISLSPPPSFWFAKYEEFHKLDPTIPVLNSWQFSHTHTHYLFTPSCLELSCCKDSIYCLSGPRMLVLLILWLLACDIILLCVSFLTDFRFLTCQVPLFAPPLVKCRKQYAKAPGCLGKEITSNFLGNLDLWFLMS